jgi:hypothetical protein
VIAKPSPSLPVTWCRFPKLAALKTAYRMEATGRALEEKEERGSSGYFVTPP